MTGSWVEGSVGGGSGRRVVADFVGAGGWAGSAAVRLRMVKNERTRFGLRTGIPSCVAEVLLLVGERWPGRNLQEDSSGSLG